MNTETAAHADRAGAAYKALLAHPPQIPSVLTQDLPPSQTLILLQATTALCMALWQDRDNHGFQQPADGIEGMLEVALDAWQVDATAGERIEAAFAVALTTLSEAETYATHVPSTGSPSSPLPGRRPTS